MKIDQFKAKIGETLEVFQLHKPARALYRAIVGAEGRKRRAKLRAFYAPLIKPGDLVYDIGANIGVYSEIFCGLRAKVIAVEPNPACVQQLKRWLPSTTVTVIEGAVGSSRGTGRLRTAETTSSSSMSDEWVRVVESSSLANAIRWTGHVEVPVLTLDDLFQQYGRPRYLKIDVEGYEESVFDGMSWQPELISFEFHIETLEAAFSCVSKPFISKQSLFNIVVGEPDHFEQQHWLGFDQLKDALFSLAVDHGFGDIFIRRPC